MPKTFAFVGNLNRNALPGQGNGISVYEFSAETGDLTLASEYLAIDNPGYLAIDEKNKRLYAAVEVPEWNENIVASFDIDTASGALSYINMQSSVGNTTCHLGFDQTGTMIFASNYTVAPLGSLPGNAVSAFAIRNDGGIEPAFAAAVHEGPNAILPTNKRQHGHCAVASPDNKTLFVCDLGLDQIIAYEMPKNGEKLKLAATPFTQLPEGAGPRHLTFHPNGKIAYVINELNCTVSVLDYDAGEASLKIRQTLPTIPEDFTDTNTCAEIAVSADGRFVYGSNRGHHSIVTYAVQQSGELSLIGWTASQGIGPRNFVIDPSGRYMLVANQKGGGIAVFKRDIDTGSLEDTGKRIDLPTPMRIVFGTF
ncbi:lactonase family protein [Phyllobacterium sp. YR531]|uniref:lactonase family protein n=1 Tax=Phyllobacterium sp. YR531 TaxID=1144343 RepID=UPI00026FBBA9|nr:lactonase family protein [Phyllobacterium sp. YR531]EJM97803.1 3-carboxymuconate cyclase [Phyllobacterium sp. YR531]